MVVRVYELKALAAFDSADFFSLFEKEGETLSGNLIRSPDASRPWLPAPSGRPFSSTGFFVPLSVRTKPPAWKAIVACVREM